MTHVNTSPHGDLIDNNYSIFRTGTRSVTIMVNNVLPRRDGTAMYMLVVPSVFMTRRSTGGSVMHVVIIFFSLLSPRPAGSDFFSSLFGAKFTELTIVVALASIVL